SLSNQTNEIRDMMASFLWMNTTSPSSSGTLSDNTVANPKISTSEPANTPVSASKPNLQASIPYPSRRNDERNREKAKDQIEKFYQLFKDMSFEISFTDALILMPKFASTLKALISNKEKLSEIARTSLNEHCSAVLLKKLPEKLGDLGKFLIPCDFSGMAECLALTDLGELTLRVGKEAITFNLDQTSRYFANYNDMTAKRFDVIDMACEEYSQEVLGFFDVTANSSCIFKELIGKVYRLKVPLLELSRFEIPLGKLGITFSGWPFVSAIPGHVAHLVANITLDSARSCVMHGAFLTQGAAFSIPTVLSWGGSIRPKGFLCSVLLRLVIIVAVVGGGVTVVVVVKSSSVVKLSFVITRYLH
nr:reverse transcriptase domain-containing protein [Tanacetum cinerariifolium]